MTSSSPHFLLFSEASREQKSAQTWRFVIHNVETQRRFSATDTEPTDCGERLELLAVVRGLEALDGPARVTLVTKSRYVSRGIKSGLAEWRNNDWSWERFGRIVPVRDHDLWQRVDRALRFHQVSCQAWQFDEVSDEQDDSNTIQELSAPADEPRVRRRVRRSRRITEPLPTRQPAARVESSQEKSGLLDRVRNKVNRAGKLPRALKAMARPMGQALGAPA